jgi:hypothetical protein
LADDFLWGYVMGEEKKRENIKYKRGKRKDKKVKFTVER